MISGHKIIVSMCHQNFIAFQCYLFFLWKICEKVIIPGDNTAWAFCQSFNKDFSSLYIATVDQIIKRRLSVHCFLQIFIPSMSIAYDQYLHFSSSFIARRALPRWLILFFSSIDSSAEVHPYSGR